MDENLSQPFEYDRIAYPGVACEVMNLRNLEVVATLAGLQPAAIPQCRVLEIGCADGANMLPSALSFPQSRFVGIDLAGEQIRQANELADAAGIRNVLFHHQSVSEVDESIGQFDYILCHGVFSWVDDQQRHAILRICHDCLAPGGIAVISYNTLPGWNFNASLREIVRLHALSFDDPRQQISEARKMIEHLADHTPSDTTHGAFYESMRGLLHSKNDAYLYHEYLTDHNRPFYFFEFQDLAAEHQLKFVVEADFRQSTGFMLNPSGRNAIMQSPTKNREQMLDFLVHRDSRRSILCHGDVEPTTSASPGNLVDFYFAFVDPLDGIDFDPTHPHPIKLNFERGSATLSDSAIKAAIRILADQWPTAVRFTELVEAAAPYAASEPSEMLASFADSLLAIYATGLLKVFKTPPQAIRYPTKQPHVSSLVRCASSRGLAIVNQWHQNTSDLSDEERALLSRLDGSRDAVDLASDLERTPDEVSAMLESFSNRLLFVS